MNYLKGLTMKEIRNSLKELGVELTSDQFDALTYDDLVKMERKAHKAYRLYKQVDDIIKASKEKP